MAFDDSRMPIYFVCFWLLSLSQYLPLITVQASQRTFIYERFPRRRLIVPMVLYFLIFTAGAKLVNRGIQMSICWVLTAENDSILLETFSPLAAFLIFPLCDSQQVTMFAIDAYRSTEHLPRFGLFFNRIKHIQYFTISAIWILSLLSSSLLYSSSLGGAKEYEHIRAIEALAKIAHLISTTTILLVSIVVKFMVQYERPLYKVCLNPAAIPTMKFLQGKR